MRRDIANGINHFEDEDTIFKLEISERAKIKILIVEPEQQDRSSARSALEQMGFGHVHFVSDHAQGLAAISEREFTHVVFSAKQTMMPVQEFLAKLLRLDPAIVALPASRDPKTDEVFDLLAAGARGYLVKPFTAESFEQSIAIATKGESLSEVILQAEDRNRVFAALIASGLDKVSVAYRQAGSLSIARKSLPKATADLKVSVDLAKMFSKGGDDALQKALIDFFIELSEDPATKLGRLRERLKNERLARKAEQKILQSKVQV